MAKKQGIYSESQLLEGKKEIKKDLMTIKGAEPSRLLKDPAFYLANRTNIRKLLFWIKDANNREDKLEYISINERSFEIFQDEKFLEGKSVQREEERKWNSKIVKTAKPLLERCGVPEERLMFYETTEAIAYHIFDYKQAHQNLLIVENEDTYFSMARCFHTPFCLGDETYTGIVYGRGKGVLGSFKNYKDCFPSDAFQTLQFGYFGDLDYEGIRIFEQLQEIVVDTKVSLCVPFYILMVRKAQEIGFEQLPNTKEKQICRDYEIHAFLNRFPMEEQGAIQEILQNRKYVPQECISFTDFQQLLNKEKSEHE